MGLYNREKMAKNREKDDSPSSLPPSSWPPRPRLSRQLPPLTTGKAITLALAVFLFVVYIAFKYTAAGGSLAKHCRCESNSMTPAKDAVGHITTLPDEHARSFQGWPTDAKDQRWRELYETGLHLAIDEASHRKLTHTSEHVPTRGREKEYIVGLDVFHQLRCLDMLRQSLYPIRYNTSLAKPDSRVDYHAWSQLDACIESLRQSLTCSADVTAIPYQWLDSKILKPQPPRTRTCRDFASIQKWASQHAVRVENKRGHVEHGIVVDYGHFAVDPDLVAARTSPPGWDKTVRDL